MKITLLAVGETDHQGLARMLGEYSGRLAHYVSFECKIISTRKWKGTSPEESKKQEGNRIAASLAPGDEMVLLDAGGKRFSSEDFASFIQERMNRSARHLVFVVGGPYGFSEDLEKKAALKLSLSPMTFTHQMVRIIFLEQLYRAFTIIRNEPYHH